MKQETAYQYVLISLGVVAALFTGIFFYREIFPEYRIYQDDFIALEKIRSDLTHEPPAPFKPGVKQIVFEREDKGPQGIDRCTSCHVALQIEAYSPTRLAKDLNGNVKFDAEGFPVKEQNPDYIWKKLDDLIAQEKDQVKANYLRSLKSAEVGDAVYDVEKVLSMHPLIGRETRPFQYHPIEEWGCTSCHGGNGRGLVTDRAHGPVLDGHYEKEEEGFVPQFLESNPDKDPLFSRVFNAKPSHRLLFQTTPIYVGALIQAKCAQCHKTSQDALLQAKDSSSQVFNRKSSELAAIRSGYERELESVASLLALRKILKSDGYEGALNALKKDQDDYSLSDKQREYASSQERYLRMLGEKNAQSEVTLALVNALGSDSQVEKFRDAVSTSALEKLLKEQKETSKGTLFEKMVALDYAENLKKHLEDLSTSFATAVDDQKGMNSLQTDVDLLTKNYQQGKNLFLSQGCYACHRISGLSRGGVGPELSKSGDGYPWFVKQSIVWPQADLKTSTMPNFRLDHDELENLVAYLLGQTSTSKVLSSPEYKAFLKEWEAGKKQPWEEPVPPREIFDLRYGMTVFAVEGCASCHRLRGFDSDVGFAIEKEKTADFKVLESEREWFKQLIPEEATGSFIIRQLEKNEKEIDKRIVSGVRKDSLIEEIEKAHPGAIQALYSNFKFAARAHEDAAWKERVDRVLKAYIQEYGLGRLICPRPNWSGVYRSDKWLMEHFKSPTSRVPRSIMPVFPFDQSKFMALTHMLDEVGVRNNEQDRLVIEKSGFNPEKAYMQHCSQCHGEHLLGNGPVSEWIYPIPKNLRSSEFLRNLTKERAVQSIMHGVPGTPMPPWGELGDDKLNPNPHSVFTEEQVRLLVDWLFTSLPGGAIIKGSEEVPKWNYSPDTVNKELHKEEVFDIREAPLQGVEKKGYYFKEKFYTKENIEAGQAFFLTNCAPCHGKEGDGAGLRAEAMKDAKPRMLINPDWISKRDDLRLLRSIKYGVPGTSMTPWGDQTTPLQRMQLVLFIRSLSDDSRKRNEVSDALYSSFDRKIAAIQQKLSKNPGDAALLKEEERLNREKELFKEVGTGFLNIQASDEMIGLFAKLIQASSDKEFSLYSQQLQEAIQKKIEELNGESQALKGKIETPEIKVEMNQNANSITSWKKQLLLLNSRLNEIGKDK